MDDDWCVLPRTRILRLFFLLPCSSLIIIQITITILSSHVNLSFHSRSSHNPPQDQSITTSPHPSPCHWPYIYSPCNIHQFFFLGGLSRGTHAGGQVGFKNNMSTKKNNKSWSAVLHNFSLRSIVQRITTKHPVSAITTLSFRPLVDPVYGHHSSMQHEPLRTPLTLIR